MPYPIIHNVLMYIFSILIMLVVSACSVGREYQSPETESLVQDRFLEQGQGRFLATEPIADWWRQFNDDQLTFLVEQALKYNLDVRIALANLQEARFLLGETKFDHFPTVEAQGNVSRQQQSKEGIFPPFGDRVQTTYNASFDSFWELNLFGRSESADCRI